MSPIDCKFFTKGRCVHQAAPRRLLGAAICILDVPSSDPRVIRGCMLKMQYERPTATIVPPPRLGAWTYDRLIDYLEAERYGRRLRGVPGDE